MAKRKTMAQRREEFHDSVNALWGAVINVTESLTTEEYERHRQTASRHAVSLERQFNAAVVAAGVELERERGRLAKLEAWFAGRGYMFGYYPDGTETVVFVADMHAGPFIAPVHASTLAELADKLPEVPNA
jgi:EAL domain-containing protein (putative c-di-GMP-specific phosphodiesterase class I)